MTSGPMGGPRPFAEDSCNIVIYMMGVGKPDNPSEKMLELEERIRANTPHVPIDGQTIYSNLPSRASVGNTVEIAVGIDEDFKGQPETIERVYKDINRKMMDVVHEVPTSYITSGDPQEELKY